MKNTLTPSKEEILEEMELHNNDEVGIDNQWSYDEAEYYLLLSDKYHDSRFVTLESVGAVLDTYLNVCMPLLRNGGYDDDEGVQVPLDECVENLEWNDTLNEQDRATVNKHKQTFTVEPEKS